MKQIFKLYSKKTGEEVTFDNLQFFKNNKQELQFLAYDKDPKKGGLIVGTDLHSNLEIIYYDEKENILFKVKAN